LSFKPEGILNELFFLPAFIPFHRWGIGYSDYRKAEKSFRDVRLLSGRVEFYAPDSKFLEAGGNFNESAPLFKR
jgi:hypothetical protein